jgi:hypothetical protein
VSIENYLIILIYTIMNSELNVDIDELALMNEDNCTELDMMNGVNNVDLITCSINLTDEVMIIFDNLVIEKFRHQDYQTNCFEKLIKIWLGENFLVASSSLDIKKETDRFNDCKAYILKTIAKYLPDGENVLYSAYYSIREKGAFEMHTDGECTIYNQDQIDINKLRIYIKILNKKILRQYNNLKYNFQVYLTEKIEDVEMETLNEDPKLNEIRRSTRNTKKIDYKPLLQFISQKKKIRRTIKDFLTNNTESKTTSKKRKVNLLLFFTYYI